MLCRQGEIQVIIAPINVLGEQTAVLLARAGVEMTINGETTTPVDVEGY